MRRSRMGTRAPLKDQTSPLLLRSILIFRFAARLYSIFYFQIDFLFFSSFLLQQRLSHTPSLSFFRFSFSTFRLDIHLSETTPVFLF
ncbi:hypothetical protein [Phaffia rhodozyma]|uniref:Uncharacterized protein n=1 Tax=Phaffia rhodozyma TaxID=264483 RepID=A0A0F7SIE0_PHARH|nr:hypothetical protein [Phaffia rhodozyma]